MSIDYKKIACGVLDTELAAIKNLSHTFQETEGFLAAVELLNQNQGRIVVSGVGKSGIIAKKIAATFSSIGKASYFLHAGDANHGDLGIIGLDDVVIIISNSGESLEVFCVVEFCKNRDIPIIAIVGKKDSTLARNATVVICMPNFKEVSHIAMPTTSTTLVSIIGDALSACLVESNTITFEEYKNYHPGGKIGKSLLKVREVMRVGKDVPVVTKDVLMSEALVIMTSGAIGCLAVVDNNSKVLGMITDGDLRRNMSNKFLSMSVSEVMTCNPKVVGLEEMAIDALCFMNKMKITSLLVVESGVLKGVIHLHDCLKVGLD
jgi:arabinose-5-phosphate isomerase